MKSKPFKIIFILSLFINSINIYAQSGCGSAAPFCAGASSYTFPAGTSGASAAPGPDYGCLFSQPNPAWYYFQVSSGGSVIIDIAGSAGGDVDFICWGPFTSATGNCGSLTAGNTVDCSFSASATETCTIAGAIVGQYYMLLITNYSGIPQNINFGLNTGSTGSTNCSLLATSGSQTICAGKTATVSASTNLGSPTYTWMPGALSTPTIIVSPAATTIYTVTIGGTNTLSATYTTVVSTSTVTVLSIPTLTLSTNSLLCPGSALNLTASSGFTNYVWRGPPALTATTTIAGISIPSATTSMMGTYTVTGRAANGCTATATNTVGLIPTSPVITTPSYTICQGGTQIFNSTNAVGATYYSWSGPASFTSSAQNPTITSIGLSQGGTYTVTAYFVVGTSTCSTKTTCSLTILPASITPLALIPTVCNNGDINLNGPSGGTSYSWTGPNSFTASIQNPIINNASLLNSGTYSVTVYTGFCATMGTVNVTVYNPLSFSISPQSKTLCVGKSTTVGGLGTGGTGLFNYLWSPTSGVSAPNSASTTITGISTMVYSLTITDANCIATLPAITTITVTVNPSPVITMSTTTNRGCEIFCTDLNCISVPTSTNCQWRFSNKLAYSGCNTSSYCFPTSGVYGATLTVTDINGCVDSLKNNTFITVDPKPNADFDWNPNNPTVLDNMVQFNDLSTIGLPLKNWHWNFGDTFNGINQDTSSSQNPTHTYTEPFSYPVYLTVVNSFGCIDSVMKIIKVEDEFALFIPNSFTPHRGEGLNDIFKVQGIGFFNDETFEMSIFDRWGALIYKTNNINTGWDGKNKHGNLCKQETYIYKIKVNDYKNKTREFIGHINLL